MEITKKKIVILEDDPNVQNIYKMSLSDFDLIQFLKLDDFETFTESHSFKDISLVIADLRLPDGFFLSWLTESYSKDNFSTPVIIVSSLTDEEIMKNCFEWGVDDYLVKPFHLSILKVKILKSLGYYQVNKVASETRIEEIIEELTLLESKIFKLLFNENKKPVAREKILKETWKKVTVNPKTLDVHLSKLRKKISHYGLEIKYVDDEGWFIG